MKVYYYIMCLCVFCVACEPNELPPLIEDVDVFFYVEGSADGEEFFLRAGPNNIVVESNAELIDGELPKFHVEFFNSDCLECNEQLIIEIIGSENFTDNSAIETFLPETEYEFALNPGNFIGSGEYFIGVEDTEVYDLQLISENGTPVSVFEDGVYALEEGLYQFFLNFQSDPGECAGSVNGGFFIDENGEVCLKQLQVEEGVNGDFVMDFSDFELLEAELLVNGAVMPLLTPILDFSIFVDAFVDVTSLAVSPLIQSEPPCFDTPLTYIFNNPITEDCFPFLEIEPANVTQAEIPRSVRITYINEDGEEYISHGPAGVNNSFIVNLLEEYNDDPFDREAYRAGIEFSIDIFNSTNDGDVIQMNITEGYIPIVLD